METKVSLAAVILAAGQGTRMKSKMAKVLHPVAGKPMLEYAVEAAERAGAERTVVVIGHQGEPVRGALGERVEYAKQEAQRGTGDAVRAARATLEGAADHVLVFYGDMPLIRSETLQGLVERHLTTGATLSLLTVMAEETMEFGRIVRDAAGHVRRIVEEVEATPEERAIREINPGIYCLRADWLWPHLDALQPSPKKGEYYLTDLVEMAVEEGARVETQTIRDAAQAVGINNRAQLAQAERIMRDRIREQLMRDGVTLTDPASTFIDAGVTIGQDTVILPNTHLQGKTSVGRDCRIGPNAILRDAMVGDACTIGPSMIEASVLEDHVEMGPFCHLRPGSRLGAHVHLGNYAEVKNSTLGPGVHMGHFSYAGDADIGARTNYSAGVITCNYDGKRKHRTVIGEDVFIGSDSMLVAPLTIGDRARTGAGAVVTKDIPADSLAVGVPAHVIRKLNGSQT